MACGVSVADKLLALRQAGEKLPQNSTALGAFDKLCAEIHPKDEDAIAHLLMLQKNLRIVFDGLIDFNNSTIDWSAGQDPGWKKAELASYAASLLEYPIRQLVGRNWKQRY